MAFGWTLGGVTRPTSIGKTFGNAATSRGFTHARQHEQYPFATGKAVGVTVPDVGRTRGTLTQGGGLAVAFAGMAHGSAGEGIIFSHKGASQSFVGKDC